MALTASIGVAVAGSASGQDEPSAQFYVKPAGSSHYTYLPGSVFQGVLPGASTTFSLKLVNTGTVTSQFRVSIEETFSSPDLSPATAVMSVNGKVIPSDGWITPVLEPGAGQVISLKFSVPREEFGSGLYGMGLFISTPQNPNGGLEQFLSVTVAQSSGFSAADVFVKVGSQPYVGGWDSGSDPRNEGSLPFETLSVLPHQSSGKAGIRLQNDSATPGRITLQADDVCFFDNVTPANSTWPITIWDGLKNVTAAVRAGTYTTAVLAPNAHKDLRLTVKNTSNAVCPAGAVYLTTSGQGQSMVTAAIATDAA